MPYRDDVTIEEETGEYVFDAGPARTVSFALYNSRNAASCNYKIAFKPEGAGADAPFFHDPTLANSAGAVTLPSAGEAKYIIIDAPPEERVKLILTGITKADGGGDKALVGVRICSRP